MWIERKTDGLVGPARIGRVTFSKTGRSVSYRGKTFESLKGGGFKANYVDAATGDEYWISGCHKNGEDALYSTTVDIDADVRHDYWVNIRNQPERAHVSTMSVAGKYSR